MEPNEHAAYVQPGRGSPICSVAWHVGHIADRTVSETRDVWKPQGKARKNDVICDCCSSEKHLRNDDSWVVRCMQSVYSHMELSKLIPVRTEALGLDQSHRYSVSSRSWYCWGWYCWGVRPSGLYVVISTPECQRVAGRAAWPHIGAPACSALPYRSNM